MIKLLEKPVFVILILLALSAYLFFFKLDTLALTDPDETFYAQTAKEMLSRGEWLTPYIYGKPQFEKPVLFYWLVKSSFIVFGVNEFAARFPPAIFGFLGLIAVYLLGRLAFGNRAGIFSAVTLAVSVEYVMLSRACITDMVLFVFMSFGALFFLYGYLNKKGVYYIASSAAFALAVLTKGPVFVLLPAGVILIFLFFRKDLRSLKSAPVLQCLAVFAVITMPWYILMTMAHGKGFIDGFFGFHNVTRFLESEHKIGSQVYYNIPVLFGGFLPWSVFLPAGFWHIYKKAKSGGPNARAGSLFVLLWFAVIFLFFTASSTKLPTYIFPAFLSIAAMTGALWDDFLKRDASIELARWMKASFYLLVVIVIAGVAAAAIYARLDYSVILDDILISGIFLALGTGISLLAFVKGRFLWAFAFIVYALCIFMLPVMSLILPEIEPYETSKDAARFLTFRMNEGERLGAESNYLAGLAFYTDKVPVDCDKHHNLVQFLVRPGRAWLVVKDKNHRQLYELDTKPYYTKPSYMVYRLGKRSIVTNMVPEDGVYILRRERSL